MVAGRQASRKGRQVPLRPPGGRALSEFSAGGGVGRYGRASCRELAVGAGRYSRGPKFAIAAVTYLPGQRDATQASPALADADA